MSLLTPVNFFLFLHNVTYCDGSVYDLSVLGQTSTYLWNGTVGTVSKKETTNHQE